jgi:hypothetical protein
MSDFIEKAVRRVSSRRGFVAKLGARALAMTAAVFGLDGPAVGQDGSGCNLCYESTDDCVGQCSLDGGAVWCWQSAFYPDLFCCECYFGTNGCDVWPCEYAVCSQYYLGDVGCG